VIDEWKRRKLKKDLQSDQMRARIKSTARRVLYGSFRGDLEEATEDVTQISIIKALGSLMDRDVEKFNAWLYRIVVNACNDYRASKASREPSLSEIGDGDSERRPVNLSNLLLAGEENDPQQAFLKLEEIRRASVIFRLKLRKPKFHAYLLVEILGLPYEEAAEITGVSIGTIKSRIHRAKVELGRMNLSEENEEKRESGG